MRPLQGEMRSAATGPAPPRRAPIARLAGRRHAWPVRAVQAAGGWRQQASQEAVVPSTAALVATADTPEADLVHVAFRWPAQMGGNDVHVSGARPIRHRWAVRVALRSGTRAFGLVCVCCPPPPR